MKSPKFNSEALHQSALKAMLADIPRQVIDQNAVTRDEIAAELNCGSTKAIKIIRAKIKSGEWEQVSKMLPNYERPVPAYRIKQ